MNTSKITLLAGSIWINDQPQILLTSSLFYFRIPASDWRDRMRTLKTLGYNTIDVYFPWNFHELEPGRWDFSGERDARAFLQQAKEEGLWVIARPGPYICSEWDGGSLPAYLNLDPDLKLRDNSSHYLEKVRTWYQRIIPLISEYQVDKDGTVILVQVENELDFYDCLDRSGLMGALRDMALENGVTVPIIACAGQGDIPGATGEVEGVVPVCNFYFDSQDPGIEERVRYYDQLMRKQGYPLCITETNRSHTDLRRLLLGGAKLIGPYLQVGGTNFGFTTGVTNWGDPLSFMTTYYDFGGMVSPGGKVRPESLEAIILTRMISAFGSALALSKPLSSPPVPVHGIKGESLVLDGGGWLIGLPNISGEVSNVTLGDEKTKLPIRTELKIKPSTCPFVLVDYPLLSMGINGQIRYATVELVSSKKSDDLVELTFAFTDSAELMVNWPNSFLEHAQGWQIEEVQAGFRLWLTSNIFASAEIIGFDKKRVVIKAIKREEVCNDELKRQSNWLFETKTVESQQIDFSRTQWRLVKMDPTNEDWFTNALSCKTDSLYLEQNNISRGFGWYRSSISNIKSLQGFLIRSGSDILSLHFENNYIGTFVPGGGDKFVPLPYGVKPTGKADVVIRAEIWGHANFDDHRLPSLRLNSMRGIGGLMAVQKVEQISQNWFYQHRAQHPADKIDPFWPMLLFGGWTYTDEPLKGIYYHQIYMEKAMQNRVLSFHNLQVTAKVFVDGQIIGEVNPFVPFVDLSNYSKPGEPCLIAVAIEQDYRRQTGEIYLYQGNPIGNWQVAGWDEVRLSRLAKSSKHVEDTQQFPINLAGGEMAWINADLPMEVDWNSSWILKFTGKELKISAWIGNHLVGRIWLPSKMRPRMAGGADERILLSPSWLIEERGKISLLLEGVGFQSELTSIQIIPES